jgi:hypothetical protein
MKAELSGAYELKYDRLMKWVDRIEISNRKIQYQLTDSERKDGKDVRQSRIARIRQLCWRTKCNETRMVYHFFVTTTRSLTESSLNKAEFDTIFDVYYEPPRI